MKTKTPKFPYWEVERIDTNGKVVGTKKFKIYETANKYITDVLKLPADWSAILFEITGTAVIVKQKVVFISKSTVVRWGAADTRT